jgi:hypothetical protein
MKPSKKERRAMWLHLALPIGGPAALFVLIPIFRNWPPRDALFLGMLTLGFALVSYYLMMSEDGD